LERPTQAVILAGGRGERLRPFTDILPKPMIQIHGKPFLEYLIIMLRQQGFERVLLLLGYLPEIVQEHFGDGSRWGLQIQYSVTPVENNTGRRIKLAEQLIDDCFVLLYCDNYWPIRMPEITAIKMPTRRILSELMTRDLWTFMTSSVGRPA
jgi:NDP-sugar pyrophosphorylase family protein